MEHPKTKTAISKLKSSNSAIENKKRTENHKKKSKSNAEIETLELKKRGVYVEKNKTSMFGRALDAADEMKEDIQEKPPKQQQREHKKFLASVLTMLSKTSTGTQQQDSLTSKAKKDESKPKVSPKHTLENITSILPSYALDFDHDKKRKYRSKILNGYKRQEDFEVLQSKKERFGTSSNSSVNDKEDTKWKSELPRLVPLTPDEIKDDEKYKTLVREVTEGKKLAEKKNKVYDPDPPTLVAEQGAHKDEKKLYNFFVDLLQSTFNVYNMDTHYDKRTVPSTASSKIALEMDESVAIKLNVATEMNKENEVQRPFDYSIKNENDDWLDNSSQSNNQYNRTPKYTRGYRQTPKPGGKHTKTRKEYETKRISISKSQAIEYNTAEERPSFYKKQKKKALLNMLKEELRMDPVSFEEPQNLYEALRVMAQQKRKAKPEKTIRYHKKTKQVNGNSPAECTLLKGRRFVLNTKKQHKWNEDDTLNLGAVGKKKSELGGHRKILQQPNIIEEYSNHSLEVYSFERFISNNSNNRETNRWNQKRSRGMIYAPYHRAISSSEEELI